MEASRRQLGRWAALAVLGASTKPNFARASGSTDRPAPKPAVLQTLGALRPGQSAILGQADLVGEFNDVARRFRLHLTGPRSRDYSLKMVWAPERETALFAGANHGSPHRLNDVWEFDLAALAWVLLYPPDNPRGSDPDGLGADASDVEFKDGVLVTRRGGPAIVGHSWWGLTYDPVQRAMLFMSPWPVSVPAAITRVGGDPALRYPGPPLWAFWPATRTWQPMRSPPPFPAAPYGAMLEYVPELGGAIWHMNNWWMRSTWLYDARADRWRNLEANATTGDFSREAPGAELVGYHDPQRKLVVVQRGRDTFHLDTVAQRWRKVSADSVSPDSAPEGHDARTPYYRVASSGQGMLMDRRPRKLWAYDPDRIRWTQLKPEGPPIPDGRRVLSYADPARDVFVVIDDRQVWVYRPHPSA